ncbi:hypothetical protein [Fusobacterium sp.]|uniref:hypothetical protein n=1 Tax=Fusobacterium sp. TaxID=68766 RepID=UPI002612C22D|nr:hypothetical protein [Fusobacterium sp.]
MKIKELKRMMTTFEDGTAWLEYEVIDNSNKKWFGYELLNDIEDNVELSANKINVNDLKTKNELYDLLYSENEILYIDEEDDSDTTYINELIKRISDDMTDFPQLEGYFELCEPGEYTVGRTIIIYIDIITKILFN